MSLAPDVIKTITRISPELVKSAGRFQAAILADVNGRRGTMHGRIRPLSPSMQVVGPAFTVEVRAGDNLLIHAAIAMAQPGDVIVVDGKADQTCALIGEIMSSQAMQRGIAGFVIDGSVRDCDALRSMGFPVFAIGGNPCGPTKKTPGRINWPISCGGTAVNPGDLVVADADGVTIVERERVAELIPLAEKKVADETKRLVGIRAGQPSTPAWLAQALIDAEITSES